jgi:uncharacterized protein with FMN-binding domain
MRRAVAAVFGAATLALPSVNAWAATTAAKATTPKKKVVTATKTFTGTSGFAGRWGDVQVTIVVKKTTTTNLATKKKTVRKRITKVAVPVYPDHTDRSVFINQQALPFLIQETIQAQSSAIDMVSGATDTSVGFQQSLQSAIVKAKAWK